MTKKYNKLKSKALETRGSETPIDVNKKPIDLKITKKNIMIPA